MMDQNVISVRSYAVRAVLILSACSLLLVVGCGGGRTLRIPPPIPADDRNIPEPAEQKIGNAADGFDKTISKPLGRALDISRQLRKLFGHPIEAYSVDAFGEVPNSTWFTNRNGAEPMTIEEIKRGPNTGNEPVMDQRCTIIAAKAAGVTPGFTIKDARGGRFIIKFDPKGWSELSTGAEVVSTKLMYAAGYNTPENYIVTFDPKILELRDGVMINDRTLGVRRAMTRTDLDSLLARIEKQPDGTIRAVASKFLPGKPIGPFRYYKTRSDDPNDFIPHEHRRELRGLYTIASWVNHWDTKAGNTLDIFYESDGRGFVKHYLIDFGSTLGSQGDEPMPLWVGYENSVDPGQMTKNTLGLGLYVPKWEKDRDIIYRSIGRFDARDFNPERFKTIVPNPAFANQTNLDGFWGARIVTSFTDAQIRAAVETGQYSNPAAAEYLAGVLIERRDIIGRLWFDKMNPVDNFAVVETVDGAELRYDDLAVARGYMNVDDAGYEYEFLRDGKRTHAARTTRSARIQLPDAEPGPLEVRIRNKRANGKWGNHVSVFIKNSTDGGHRILAVQRQD